MGLHMVAAVLIWGGRVNFSDFFVCKVGVLIPTVVCFGRAVGGSKVKMRYSL